jgi:hypothetical protein
LRLLTRPQALCHQFERSSFASGELYKFNQSLIRSHDERYSGRAGINGSAEDSYITPLNLGQRCIKVFDRDTEMRPMNRSVPIFIGRDIFGTRLDEFDHCVAEYDRSEFVSTKIMMIEATKSQHLFIELERRHDVRDVHADVRHRPRSDCSVCHGPFLSGQLKNS